MKDKKIPRDVEKIITALCHDYKRRKEEIEHNVAHGRTRLHYERLNRAIDAAFDEECDPWMREDMLTDISQNRGFRKTRSSYITQQVYYENKRRIKHSIAKKLHLL